MMTFPIYGKIKNVPNHQPVLSNFIVSNYENLELRVAINDFPQQLHRMSPPQVDTRCCTGHRSGADLQEIIQCLAYLFSKRKIRRTTIILKSG